LFDVLKQSYPDQLKKIVPLLGDCMELGLGLSPSDRQMLEEKVSIIFHCAATVRFDDTLKNSVITNTRGTREMMVLASSMKELKVCGLEITIRIICTWG
jgi:fatty acyl-CoA reductase